MPINSIYALFKGSDMSIYNAGHFLEQFWPDIINKLYSTRQQLNPVTYNAENHWRKRLQACIKAKGQQTEHLL